MDRAKLIFWDGFLILCYALVIILCGCVDRKLKWPLLQVASPPIMKLHRRLVVGLFQ